MITGHPEQDIYDFIVAYARKHKGNSPTYRAIADGCGFASASTVNYHVRKLIQAGLLTRIDDALCVVDSEWRLRPARPDLPPSTPITASVTPADRQRVTITAAGSSARAYIEDVAPRYGHLYARTNKPGDYLLVVSPHYEAEAVAKYLMQHQT